MRYLPKKVDPHFMIRILKDEVTEGEREFFDAWLEESDEHKEEFASIALVWDRMGQARVPPEPDPDVSWEHIQQRIEVASDPLPKTIRSGQPARGSHSLIDQLLDLLGLLSGSPARYGVAFILLAGVVFGLLRLYEANIINDESHAIQTLTNEFMQEVITTRGERATVTLADGSTVFLNSDSRLRISNSFGVGVRAVELEGEAYFAVMPDADRPFRVNTGDTYTEVRGTEFNVRFRNDLLRVVVSKGAVRLTERRGAASVDLRRGEFSSYVDSSGFTPPRKVDVAMYIAWRENKLAFAKTPLADVMSEIELTYNINVVVRNPKASEHTLTGYFVRDSLDEVLSAIALAMDIKIKREGQTVIVY